MNIKQEKLFQNILKRWEILGIENEAKNGIEQVKTKVALNEMHRQLQTKYLEDQTKKMEERLNELKKQVEQQKQLKASQNLESTVSRWKKNTRSDAPLKSYAKQILEQQKQAYKKFGIDQKKITGTKTFSTIKKRLQQEKLQQQEKNPTKILSVLSKTSQQQRKQPIQVPQLPSQTIQNNFFKAKIDVKNLVKQKTVLEFLEEIFLQQYHVLFMDNNITELGDLRFLTQEQLGQMGLPRGHQIKILKRVKEEFEKTKSPSKMTFNISNQIEQKTQKPAEKKVVEMGYGDGNINHYAEIEAHQNAEKEFQQKFDDADSQNVSEAEENDVVLITVPLSQIGLQTGNQSQDQDDFSQEISNNCFNCYKAIPLGNQLHQSPDKRNFCSANCLKVYKLQMQKTCPACGNQFFKTEGYYEQELWFCSINCCPNKDEIEEMFLEWTQKERNKF